MKKIISILVLLFFVPSFAYSQKDSGFLKLSIKPDKAVYKTGEPVHIEYQITNSSDAPISIDPPFSHEGIIDPNFFSGIFFIQREEDGNSIEVFPMADIDWTHVRAIEIPPHGNYSKTINVIGMVEHGADGEVAYSSNLFLYKGGRYKIIAKFIPRLIRSSCWKSVLESNTVFITVQEKKYISESEALRIAKKACLQSQWEWADVKLRDMASEEQYIVVTHASQRDGYVEIHIDKKSGKVLRKFKKE